jgi:general secretion pathway protein B
LVTFVATWLLLKPERIRENSAHPIVAKVSPSLPTPQVTVETSPIPSVPPVVPVQLTRPQTPSAPAQVPPVRRPVSPSKPQESIVQPAPAHEDDEGRETRRRTKEQNGQSLPADQSMVAPADIKLSGIAWQEERRSRRAVVNGFLMQEGGVVSGARITAIYQDRVRFSLSGKTFEIPLIASTAPTAGK